LKDFIAPVPFHASTCASPSITTALSSSAGNDGATVVHDSATLSVRRRMPPARSRTACTAITLAPTSWPTLER
jgi:hypothetical protein